MGFLNDAFLNNKWLWFHMLAAAILTKLFHVWLTGQVVFLIILVLAVGFEVWEYFTTDVEKVYGSKKKAFMDSVGDVLGAILITVIILL